MANCKYCSKEITWMKDGHKNVPVESDGGIHKCEKFIKSMNSYREIDPKSLSEAELKRLRDGLKKKK
ncbi:MAG: hypothetical protein JNM93_14280 [Bacteriovoracaceae bacterium]|nr:hypothetical protein [Bacteriovoracaceae bacterium]